MADEQDTSTETPQTENPMDGIPERFTEEPVADGQADVQAGGEEMSPLTINAQYVKDLSFEAPNTPGVFEHLQTTAPEIGVEVDINANAMGENRFEAAIKLRAEARVNDTVVYIIELEYAGLFTINVPEEHLGTVLLIDCPLILFPFARRIIADTTSDGSMAPLMLAPIDFAALYQQKFLEQQAAEGNAEA